MVDPHVNEEFADRRVVLFRIGENGSHEVPIRIERPQAQRAAGEHGRPTCRAVSLAASRTKIAWAARYGPLLSLLT